MKKLLIAAAVAALGATAASADTRAPAVPYSNWTGFYAGVSGGYGGNERDSIASPNDAVSALIFPVGGFNSTALGPSKLGLGGGFGGIQAGYNRQFSNMLVGIETDFNLADIRSDVSVNNLIIGNPAGLGTLATSEKLKWFGTVKARLGYLATKDILLFATGGIAYGKVEQSASYTTIGNIFFNLPPNAFTCLPNASCFAGSDNKTEVGYTVGAGTEWMFWKNVSLKAEYSYINLGNASYRINVTTPVNPAGVSSMQVSTTLDYHIVRAGLNWHF